ncbi:hypothetical protein PtA15_6A630 [Puccinia triticina]|uniref:Uncharacterized protein n=1 Tax=Puccinia triticina TaxID=208348 RepID=A0ABY7CQE7_9BASI|nr:uncharacterized protein PtA15_6A630 [Puccinia triticina]WAQ86000.1 hypothetical protein PtA15_6A630 [Puccinia triticina]
MPCIDCGAAVADRVYQLIGALLVAAPAVAAHPSSKCEHHQPFLAAASSPSAHFSGDLQYNTLLITPLTSSSVPALQCLILISSVAEPNLSCLLLSQANRHSNGSHRVSGDSSPLALISDDKELSCKEADNMRRPAKAAKPSLVGDNVDWMCAPPDFC